MTFLKKTEDRSARRASVPQVGSTGAAALNKHQQKTELTKRKLIKSALRVFARDGFEAARIDDIASEAGHTRGAFYAHFQSKEDLFFAMLEDQSHKHMDAIARAVEGSQNDDARLAILRDFLVGRLKDRQWSILIIEFKLYALRHPKLRARLAERYRSIRAKVKEEALGRVWPVTHDPSCEELMRVALQIMINGLALELSYDPSGFAEGEAESLIRKLFDYLMLDKT